MLANQKVTGRAASIPIGVGIGVLISLLITILGATVVAWLILTGRIAEGNIGYGSIVILLLSSGIGAYTAWKLIKHQRLLVCMVQSAVYYLVLLGCTALFFGGQYQGMGVTALVVLAGCGSVILLGLRREKKGKIHLQKTRFR